MKEQLPDLGEATEAVAQVLERACTSLETTNTWLAIADSQGVVTADWATTNSLRKELQRHNVDRGADFALEHAGRNGIGLALLNGKAAFVTGEEHEDDRLEFLACAAVGVRHPFRNETMAVLNLTTRARESTPFLRYVLQQLSSDIGRAIYQASPDSRRQMFESHLQVRNRTPNTVVTLNATNMIVGGGEVDLVWTRNELWNTVLQAGPTAQWLTLSGGHRARVVPVERNDLGKGVSLIFTRNAETPDSSRENQPQLDPIAQAERRVILEALQQTHGDKKAAAALLSISRGTLYSRLRRYNITA